LREYETTFIIQPEITDEGIQAICGRLEGILDNHGATKLFYDDMGRRRLAYEIKKFQKGQYLTLFFLDEGKAVPDLERSLRLDDSILRFLTVLGNPEVADIEARKAEALELERARAERAAEKAAREAEEEAARAAEEAARAAEEAERAAAAPAPVEAAEGAPAASDETGAPAPAPAAAGGEAAPAEPTPGGEAETTREEG
jgi:small subunit ribosomal protein S6